MNSGIYKITCIVTGKMYVGSSVNISKRWTEHKRSLNGTAKKHHSIKLQRAWDKYGEENFVFEIIEYCEINLEVLIEKEQYWVDTLDSYNNGYNSSAVVGRPNLGVTFKHTDEAKEKIRQKAMGNQRTLGKPLSEEHKEKIRRANTGRKMSLEAIQHMSEAQKGHEVSDETRLAMSERMKGNTYSLGFKHTDETRKKMGESRKGKKQSEENVLKRSLANTGKKRTDEQKENIRQGQLRYRAKQKELAENGK